MKKLHIGSVKPGDQIARHVFSDHGKILLGRGKILTPLYILKLKNMGIETIYVEDVLTDDITPDEPISDHMRSQSTIQVEKEIAQLIEQPQLKERAAVQNLAKVFQLIYKNLLEQIRDKGGMMLNLSDLHVKDDYLFQQSLNVAAISIILGISKGYDQNQLQDLGIGALMADIGMVKLPRSLWNRGEILTKPERDLLHTHPEEGYRILQKQNGVSAVSALCARQHHERFDGTGYPYGLTGQHIHEYAQIIGIADVYTALTSTRTYRKKYTPSEAIEYLLAIGNSQFDIDLIRIFCNQVAIYPVASTVVLNTGEQAVVVKIQPSIMQRPVVRVIREADGSKPSSLKDLDLSLLHHYTIIDEL